MRRPHARFLLALLVATTLATPAFAQGDGPPFYGVRPDGSSGEAPADPPGDPGTPTVEKIASGLNAPTNLAFGPDGTLYYGEYKTGAVYPIGDDGKPVDHGNPVIDVGEPAWGNERGFVGLAVGPQGEFYTFTTYEYANGSWYNRLSKWVDGQETPILDKLDADDWHNAGRIQVDPRDGTLWVAYGDVNKYDVAQDPNDLRGKILHMTSDGEPVEGNIAPDSLVYSLGHRQPFGFAVDWPTGQVMVAENMDTKNDEVSFVEPGGNYGWPECEGLCETPDDRFTEPILHYPRTIGPTSGAWLGGDFYFGEFNFANLHRIYQGDDGKWYDHIVHTSEDGPIIDLKPGPEGNTFYYSTWSGIVRLTFPNIDATSAPTYDGQEPGSGDGGETPTDGGDTGTDGTDGTDTTDGTGDAGEDGSTDAGTDGGDGTGEVAQDTPAPGLALVALAAVGAALALGRAGRRG